MKKVASFVWDKTYQLTFDEIKVYLIKPLNLATPESSKPFLIYVRVMNHILSILLALVNDEGCKLVIYYKRRTMIGDEHCYNPVEKKCLALVFAV